LNNEIYYLQLFEKLGLGKITISDSEHGTLKIKTSQIIDLQDFSV
jgi:hypothetical protein